MKNSMMYKIRESPVYAYLAGFYERTKWVDGFGRTHETNSDWNDYYDKGANLSDKLFNREA